MKILDYIKKCWKIVVTFCGVLGIMMGIFAFDSRYAKSQEIVVLEAKTASTIEEVKKTIQIQQDLMRLDNLNDQLLKTKLMIKTYPEDNELKEDYQNLQKEKINVKKKLEEETK